MMVPTRDHVALADAIRTLLADEGLQQLLAKKGRRRILELFNWKVAAADMVNLYREVVPVKGAN